MIDEQPRDREIRAWIQAEAPDRAPDRLRETIRAELAQTRQERGPSRLAVRPVFALPLRLAAAAVVVAVGAAAVGLMASRPVGPGVTPPPASPTPTPSASVLPASPVPTPVGIAMPAGPYSTVVFKPKLHVTTPVGWLLQWDQRDTLSLARPAAGWLRQGDGAVYFDGVNVYARPVAGQPDGAQRPVEGVGTKAKDLATWLSKRPQLTATTPLTTTLGGVPAYRLDFQLSPQAGTLCGIPCANLLDGPDNAQSYAFGIEGPWKVRAWLLDAPDGSTLLVTIEDTDGVGFGSEAAAAQSILDSLSFAP